MEKVYECGKIIQKARGITLIALVVTIVVLLILAGITISLVFSENGVANKAREAEENTKIAQVREKLELAKGPEYNGDGTYEVTTSEGYIFIITLVPSKDNVEDIQIDYSGKANGPRIRKITVTSKTTNSVTVEVDTANADGAKYTYYYKKDEEADWIKADEVEENIYIFNGLEANVLYNIKVELEKDKKKAEKEINIITGEMPEGAVQFSPVVWNNGKASTIITTTETGYILQYKIGGEEEKNWTNATSGTSIGNLQHGQTVYGRLYDGINGSKMSSIDIKDTKSPTVTVNRGTITNNSITVNVQAIDNESGLASSGTYKYYLNGVEKTTSENNTYTFTGLAEGTTYTVKVEAFDKAGNKGNQTINATTIIRTVSNTLQEGKYVNYVTPNNRNSKMYSIIWTYFELWNTNNLRKCNR